RRHTRFSRDWSSDVCSSDLDGDIEELEDEAVIHTGIEIDHAGNALETDNELQHEDDDELTINEVYETLDEEQRNVVNYLIGVARSEERRVGKEWRSRAAS